MQVIGPLRETPVDEIGLVLPTLLLPLWDSEIGKGFIATLRSLLGGADVSLVRSFLQEVITVEIGSRVDDPPGSGAVRVQFVASQLVGVVVARYILELEPFASLSPESIAKTIAPNLQRYLTGGTAEPELTRRSCSASSVTATASSISSTGDVIDDRVHAAQPGVVQAFAGDVQQRAVILGADQDAQKSGVEHDVAIRRPAAGH